MTSLPLPLPLSLPLLRRSDSPENDLSVQIVPELEGRPCATAFTVPMKNEELSPTSLSGANMASSLTMMEVQLTSISPTHLESHSSLATSPVHLATSPVHPGPIPVHGSPVHAAGQRILLTSDLPSAYTFASLPLPPHPNGSPFVSPSTSPPFLSASPTNNMGSAVSSPLNIPGSPSHSVSASLFNGHRPVGPSQSVDSFFTTNVSHSLPNTLLHSAAHYSPQHVHNVLPSVSESGRNSEGAPNAYNIVSSPADSLVTIRSTPIPSTSRNRHSYTNGDASVFNFVPSNLHLPLHVPRQRRNSSGSQDLNSTRTRRSSHSSVMSTSASLDSAFLASHRRGRRRSHDAYVDRDDIVANFGPLAVSQRRTSRSSSREPYNV